MKIHEYQARELLEQYGIAVPRGELARTPEEASAAAGAWGGEAVIKAQVLTGGRGKAGAIRVVSSQTEAESTAREILAMSVKGFEVQQVLVTECLDIRAEYYAAITVDRESRTTVLIISAAGGMDIEEIAAKEPEKIRRFAMPGAEESQNSEDLAQWLSASFPDQTLLVQAAEIVQNMNRLFRDKDCSLVEINPLAVTAQERLIAADAKIVFDDNAIAQHPEIAGLRNPEEYTADEIEAKDAGLSFVSLSGEIGCMVNGAGLAMATMDGIKLAGGRPANFLDVGGSSNPQKVLDAMRILLRNDQLKIILVNIFGGITRCDDVAQGILMARDKLGIAVPMVIRLIGTNEEKGRKMLSEAGMIVASRMTDAIRDAVNCTRGGTQP
ncbi:MAG: succinate--CoA ligase subunit beta [Planctomycetes bacterium B3_Pla]|nr:MAG: succinate--CoA ligase subunit beta [Planctomycetes bacterium B3_Pla]